MKFRALTIALWLGGAAVAFAEGGMTNYTPGQGEDDPATKRARAEECKSRDARRQELGNILYNLRLERSGMKRMEGMKSELAAKDEEIRKVEAERKLIQPCDVSSAMESASGPI